MSTYDLGAKPPARNSPEYKEFPFYVNSQYELLIVRRENYFLADPHSSLAACGSVGSCGLSLVRLPFIGGASYESIIGSQVPGSILSNIGIAGKDQICRYLCSPLFISVSLQE